jgi:hypothetical protein
MTASSPVVPDMRKYTSWAHGTISLVNGGDEVLVLDGSDTVVDSLSWGDSSWAFYPACPSPGLAMTLERFPAYMDTDTSSDWRQQSLPAPGGVDLVLPTTTPTLTPTQTSTRTASSTATVSVVDTITPTTTRTRTITTTLIQTHTPTHTPTRTSTITPEETIESTCTNTTTPTPTSTPSFTPTRNWLLISEVMNNPAGIEPDSEWIELYNAGNMAMNLSNYKIGDEETQVGFEGMYQFPLNATILSEQAIIIANRADVFTSTYGFYPDYEFNNSDPNVPDMNIYLPWAFGVVNLDVMGDEVLLLDESDSFVDAVSWGDSNWAFDPDCPVVATNHSLERFPANVDTDSALDWIDQALPNPGQVNTLKR